MPETPPRIHLLTEPLINQIAAGEVVDRPASVIKELLENSLDASAKRIEVEIEEGGLRLMRVKDDGWGIEPDDLPLAICRHATSKIGVIGDLERVHTLGFRGEALSSIGSVSRLLLSSRVRGQEAAWSVTLDGGDGMKGPAPAPRPAGTTVEVRDLFYNIPARRKFVRGPRTEYLLVQQVVKRLALSRFDVSFRLAHNRRPALNLTASPGAEGRLKRIRELCGGSFTEQSLALDVRAADIRLWGWLGSPALARSQSDAQYLFLNGRAIRDKTMSHALRRAYQDRIDEGKHPAYVLYIELDPGRVDVNVHPAKAEVRFRDGRLVHDIVYSAVHKALEGPAPESFGEGGTESPAYPRSSNAPPRLGERLGRYGPASPARAEPRPSESPDEPPLGSALTVVEERYLIARNHRGVVAVDIEAAVRRLIAERFKASLSGAAMPSEPLLIPEPITLSEAELESVLSQAQLFARLGLVLERAGPQILMLRQVPALLRGAERGRLIRDLLEILEACPRQALEGEREAALLSVLAFHGCIGRSSEDLNALLRELESKLPSAEWRGVIRQLSGDDLARLISAGEGAPLGARTHVRDPE